MKTFEARKYCREFVEVREFGVEAMKARDLEAE
jgi:hypothetical protein